MSTRAFAIGVAVCLVIVVAIGAVISAANGSHHRPEGAAERWLSAASDTTRKGVHDDAVKRTEKIGPMALVAPLLPADTDGKGAFPDLEVGKAKLGSPTGPPGVAEVARVPYRLHQRALTGSDPVKSGTIVLTKAGESWHVTSLADRAAGEEVPSEGGAPPSSAPGSVWIGGILAGALLTVVSSLLVEWAARSSRNALAAT